MVIDRLLGLESHDERKDELKSYARQRLWRMVAVFSLFLMFAMAASASTDEPSTTQRLIDICRMF